MSERAQDIETLDLELCAMYAWYERQADLELQSAPFQDEWFEYINLNKGETNELDREGKRRRA